jgi:hypothetical protein
MAGVTAWLFVSLRAFRVIVRPLVPALLSGIQAGSQYVPYESEVLLPCYAGAIGPQPHPNSIEVSCEAALGWGDGEVARAPEDAEGVKGWPPDRFPRMITLPPRRSASGGREITKYCGVDRLRSHRRRLLAHDRRRIVNTTVTAHPTAAWTVQQCREAFPWDRAPRYLIRDRDHAFDGFRTTANAMGVHEVLTAPHLPWQNAYAERFIASVRVPRTCHRSRPDRTATDPESLLRILRTM